MADSSPATRLLFCPCGRAFKNARAIAVHSMACAVCTDEVRFWQRVNKTAEGCWLWTGARNDDGYGHFRKRGTTGETFAHRYSYELHKGPLREGLSVMHSCDVPHCVNPDHLALGSHGDNMKDMERKGRSTQGEKNYHAKLRENQVIEIRHLRNGRGWTLRELAARFSISQTVVQQICAGRKWRHLL